MSSLTSYRFTFFENTTAMRSMLLFLKKSNIDLELWFDRSDRHK